MVILMKKLFTLFLLGAIASGCVAQTPSPTPDNTQNPPQAEVPTTPEAPQDIAQNDPSEITYVHFNVQVTSGPFANPSTTGLKGWYSYQPANQQILDLQFIDQVNNDISSYCQDFTLSADGLGLNGVCELPGGSYQFGSKAQEAKGENAFSYVFDAGPGGEGVGSVNYTKADAPADLPIESARVVPPPSALLQVGTVKNLVTGDLLCYATVLDENSVEHELGASFELCADASRYLNKKVRLSYTEANINDCQSIEPCGKTRKETIIQTMQIVQ